MAAVEITCLLSLHLCLRDKHTKMVVRGKKEDFLETIVFFSFFLSTLFVQIVQLRLHKKERQSFEPQIEGQQKSPNFLYLFTLNF